MGATMDNLNCKRCTELLLDYQEGTLDAETTVEFEQHMKNCECCRVLLATYAKTSSLCCATLKAVVPKDVEDRVLSFLRGKMQGFKGH